MSRITRIIAAALAMAALAVTPALARQADDGVRTSSLAGTVAPHQDLRGERALDAAYGPGEESAADALARAESGVAADAWPTPGARAIHPYAPASTSTTAASDDGADPWLLGTIGLAGALTLLGTAVLTRRHRVAV